jgi:hypothetical protein
MKKTLVGLIQFKNGAVSKFPQLETTGRRAWSIRVTYAVQQQLVGTWLLLQIFKNVFGRFHDLLDCLLDLASRLVQLAFSTQLVVVGERSCSFFNSAFDFIASSAHESIS